MFKTNIANPKFQPLNQKTLNADDKKLINLAITKCAESKDAYNLNMALLLCLQFEGYTERSQKIKRQWLAATEHESGDDWMHTPSARQWLMARAKFVEFAVLSPPKPIIDTMPADENGEAMLQWAQAYQACLSQELYKKLWRPMVVNAEKVTTKYLLAGERKASDAELQNTRSNAVWCWVMTLLAAAVNGSTAIYATAKAKIMSFSPGKTLSGALLENLLRTPHSNDYPAWALAYGKQAATLMRDDLLLKELTIPLVASITAAKAHGASTEAAFAIMGSALAAQLAAKPMTKTVINLTPPVIGSSL